MFIIYFVNAWLIKYGNAIFFLNVVLYNSRNEQFRGVCVSCGLLWLCFNGSANLKSN